MKKTFILLFVAFLLTFGGCALIDRDYAAYKYAKTDSVYGPKLKAAEDKGEAVGKIVGSLAGGIAPIPGGSLAGESIGDQIGKGFGILFFILFNATAILKKKEEDEAATVTTLSTGSVSK